jgi:hypothetical protein
MAIYLTLVGATTWMTFALARRVLFGVTALLPPLILSASIALIDMPSRFAGETLLAFLLTASVLLLVKAHETMHERAARARIAEAAAWPAAHDDHTAPDGADWAAEAAARPAAHDDYAAPDDSEWAPPDDGEWAILDDLPPRRRRGLSAGMLVLLAGLALSSTIVVQPRAAVLLPFVAAWLALALPRRFAAVFVLFALLLPAGWIARDYALYGQTVPASMRQPFSADPNQPVRAVDDRLASLISPWNPVVLERAVHAWGAYGRQGWDYHDLLPASTRADHTFRGVDDDLAIGLALVYALLALLGVLSLWVEGRGSTARLIALPLVTLPVVYVAFNAEDRVLLPLLPLLSVALALGLLWLGDHLNVRANRR